MAVSGDEASKYCGLTRPLAGWMPGTELGPAQPACPWVSCGDAGPASSLGRSCVVSFLLVPLFGPEFPQEQSQWGLGRT